MKHERQPPQLAVTGAPIFPNDHADDDTGRDEAFQELCDLWPDHVDLAKQRGLLLRLYGILNA